MPDLALGSEGKDVEEVQKALNLYCDNRPQFAQQFKEELSREGLPVAPRLTESGRFDTATRAAVIAFQTYKRLGTVNGIVGRQTLVALFPCGTFRVTCAVQLQPPLRPVLDMMLDSVDEARERQRRQFAALMRAVHPAPPPPPDLMRMREDELPGEGATIITPDSGVTMIPPTISPTLSMEKRQLPLVGLLDVPRSPLATNALRYTQVQVGLEGRTFGHHWWNPNLLNPKKANRPYNTFTVDFIGILYNYWGGKLTTGWDLGVTSPQGNKDRSQGAVPSAAIWWSIAYAPHWVLWGRWDLLSAGAKIGVRLDGTEPKKGDSSLSGLSGFGGGSLSVQTRFDLVRGDPIPGDAGRKRPPKLSIYAKISESIGAEMTFDNGDVTGKMGMSGVVGISGNL